MKKEKIIIQGYEGSFHDLAAQEYFGDQISLVPAASFNELGQEFAQDESIDYGIMAIENSIAGTILPNYRILREKGFQVVGEIYLRIKMNLMALPGQQLSEIKEVHSHPMALYQCLRFLNAHLKVPLVESEDTALSAKKIREQDWRGVAAIANDRAAQLYGLEILAEGIEDNTANYTRFFIISRTKNTSGKGDKASIWCRLKHEKGSLLELLTKVKDYDINLSKLQSFPVLGELTEYFFHLDLEFDDLAKYKRLCQELKEENIEFKELGVYKRADISAALRKEEISVML